MKATERRRFQRVAFNAPVCIVAGDRRFTSQAIDVSLKGALVKRPEDWQTASLDQRYHIELSLDGADDVVMKGRLTHEEGDHLGFESEEIDLDSATSLRRLVELNIGDPNLLNRELQALVNCHRTAQ